MKVAWIIAVGLSLNASSSLDAGEDKPLPSVFIGDGTRIFAADALRSLVFATKQFGGEIRFLDGDGETKSISCASEESMDVCFGCFASFEILVGRYSMNEEKIDYSEMVERIKTYSESARLTDSRPVVLINASPGVSGIYLVKLLNAMEETGGSWLVRPVPTLLEKSPMSNSEAEVLSPRRKAERQPYKIDLEN